MGVIMGGFLLLLFIVVIIYFIIRYNNKKIETKYKQEAEYRRAIAPEVDIYSDDSFKKQIVFRYRDWDGKTYKKRIIPFYKNEHFLEGYCLDTRENDLFTIDRIVSFGDGSRAKFEALGRDPSIMTHEEVADKESYRDTAPKRKSATIENKGHKNWDEKNPTEIFFRYRNADGKTKNRVVQLINYDTQEIKGFCKMAKGIRTFKFDRIQTFYKDSKDRLEAFRTNPHFNRDILTISFVGFSDNQFEDYKDIGNIYNYRALKTITKNTSIVVYDNALTEAQTRRVEENQCALVKADNFAHFLETGEVHVDLD